jgi:hypothetical protein
MKNYFTIITLLHLDKFQKEIRTMITKTYQFQNVTNSQKFDYVYQQAIIDLGIKEAIVIYYYIVEE